MIYSQMHKEILSKINQGKIIKNPAPQILRPRGNWEKCTKLSVVDFTACALCVCSMGFKVPLEIKKRGLWSEGRAQEAIPLISEVTLVCKLSALILVIMILQEISEFQGSLISTYQEYFHPNVNRVGIGYDLVFQSYIVQLNWLNRSSCVLNFKVVGEKTLVCKLAWLPNSTWWVLICVYIVLVHVCATKLLH